MKIAPSLLLAAVLACLAAPVPAASDAGLKNPDGSYKFTNALAGEKSPYLLQHAHNPVNWYPWGDAAFEKARTEDKPVFLSIGYSTCHWCHVMEEESFVDPEVARIMNESFVAIKVDREERPDVDEVYMSAVQIAANAAGWPQNTVLLADGRPFAGAMYLPKNKLIELLKSAAAKYKTERVKTTEAATRLVAQMEKAHAKQDKGSGELTAQAVRKAADKAMMALKLDYDTDNGGFGQGAPKFPMHAGLSLLLTPYAQEKNPKALQLATGALDAMALGGIRDHLGGGFHRYTIDAAWRVPHFEKTLYDNAQLGRAYTDAYALTHREFYKQVADEIYGWVLREMTSPEGGFYSAVDADSDGGEGKYYTWTKTEIDSILGVDAALFERVYHVQPDGNYKDQATGRKTGANVLYLDKPVEKTAADLGQDPVELSDKLAGLRAKLLAAREKRARPGVDDKILADWNGLMIGSLAHAGEVLGEPQYIRAANRAEEFVVKKLVRDEKMLFHRWRDGETAIPAYEPDYAFMVDGLVDIMDATGEAEPIEDATLLADKMLADFWDPKDGGLFETATSEKVLIRLKNPYDAAIPSGNAVAARALCRLGMVTGNKRYTEWAQSILASFAGTLENKPHLAQGLVQAAVELTFGPPAATPRPELHEEGGREHDAAASRDADRPGNPAGDGSAAGGEAPAHLTSAADLNGESPVTVTTSISPKKIVSGKMVTVTIKVSVAHGWHINSHTPHEDYLIPTKIGLNDPGSLDAAIAGAVTYPPGKDVTLGFSTSPVSVYEETVAIAVPVVIRAAANTSGVLTFVLSCQACNDHACLAPERRAVQVPISVSPR